MLQALRQRIDYARLAPLVTLLVLVIASACASEYFLQYQNLLNILRQVSYSGTIALGMTFVIIAGGIDLSVGSLTALAGGVSILVLNRAGGGVGGIALAVLAGVMLGTLGGALNGLIVTRGRIAPFIATLGTMSIFRSLTLYISGAGEFRSTDSAFAAMGSGRLLTVPVPVWVFLLVAATLHVLLNHTPYGRYACAVGASEGVARYSAIRVRWVKFVTYLITGATVGISSVLLAARFNSISSSNAAVFFELDAIAAVIIGGTSMAGGSGSIAGTLIGAVILGVINNMLNLLGVSAYLQGTVKGAVIIVAVLMQYRRKG